MVLNREIMRKYLLIIGLLILSTTMGYAQDEYSVTRPVQSAPIKAWTASFNSLDVDGQVNLKLIKIDKSEAPYVVYNIKDGDPTKFSFEVEKGGTLKIRERGDNKRTTITDVEVYFNELTDISIAKASTVVEGTLTSPLVDINISNDARFSADIDNLDLYVVVTGKSVVTLRGTTLYHTADISTAEYNASELQTTSTVTQASHNAVVRVDAQQRLVAKSSTGGKILYKSYPQIYRAEATLFGGEIRQM